MSPELHARLAQPVGDRLGHGVRLLVDLLEHEGLVAALLGGLLVPVDLCRPRARSRSPSGVEEPRALGRDRHDLAVVDQLHAAGLGHERGDGGGDEALAVAEAHHQRALLAGAHQHVGLVGGHRDERVVAAQVVVGEPHGLDQVAVEVRGDQVRHHLGVGLGGELGALGLAAGRAARSSSRRSRSGRCGSARRCPSAGGRSPRSRGRAWPSACGRCRSSPSGGRSTRATASRRFCRLPTACTLPIAPSVTSDRPAES